MGRGIQGAVLCLAVIFCVCDASWAGSITVTPDHLRPGDAFMVEVKQAGTSSVAPDARFAPGEKGRERRIPLSPVGDGRWVGIGAIDLEAEPGQGLVKAIADRAGVAATLYIEKGVFPEQAIALPKSQVYLSPKDQARADGENREMDSFWPISSERLWKGVFNMPLENGVSTEFGARRVINSTKHTVHKGLDIRGAVGDSVRAPNRGIVVYNKNTFYGGNTVIVDHGAGVYTLYMHLSKSDVITHQVLGKGDLIGKVGSTGRATGPHLHYGLKVGGVSADPASITKLPL